MRSSFNNKVKAQRELERALMAGNRSRAEAALNRGANPSKVDAQDSLSLLQAIIINGAPLEMIEFLATAIFWF